MRAARNDKELDALILADLKRAMENAEWRARGDLMAATWGFYSGDPTKYRRTGMLARTPKTEKAGGDAGFRAYLDTSYTYPNGSHPGMETVLGWAEKQEAGLVGGPLEWDKTETEIIKDAEAALKEYFA